MGMPGCVVAEATGAGGATGDASAALEAGNVRYSGTLGLGVTQINDDETELEVDVTGEVANAQILTQPIFDVANGIVFEVDCFLSGEATIDIDFGLADALVVTAFAGTKLAVFHYDGASENLLAAADDDTVPISATDTLVDNVDGTHKNFIIILRGANAVPEFYIDKVRVLATTFDTVVLMSGDLMAFFNLEKTNGAALGQATLKNIKCYGGSQ